MMRAAEAQGAELRIGRGHRPGDAAPGGVTGVEVDGETIARRRRGRHRDGAVVDPGTRLAAAAGGLRPQGPQPRLRHRRPACRPRPLFLEYREAGGEVLAPELFPRPDGTTYVCAISSESPLPVDPAEVAPDDGAIERLEAICADVSPVLAAAKVLRAQACFRPVTRDGLPLIGRVPGVEGAYVATGHSVWGILNAPATGEAMAELITEGRTRAVDLSPFDPPACRRSTRRACAAPASYNRRSAQSGFIGGSTSSGSRPSSYSPML